MKFYNKIIKFFKSIFIPKDQKEEIEQLNKLLSETEIGEIIWAKRYKNEFEKLRIKKGHQIGPYVVLGKSDKGLICSAGTSVEHSEQNKYIKLDSKKYNMHHQSYFKLFQFETITPNTFTNKYKKLDQDDILRLYRAIKLKNSNDNYYKENINFSIPLQIGDLISISSENYLIIDIKNDKLLCAPITKSYEYLIKNNEFKDYKNLDYSKMIWLNNKSNIKYIKTVNDNILLYALKSYKEYIELQKNKKNTQRGSVIRKENQYYYIYGEEGQEWLVLEVFKDNNSSKYKIILNKQIFYTSYNDLKISKYDEFETLFIITQEEIDNIKESRKNYINHKKRKEKQKEYLKRGDIIQTKYYRNQRFIIVKICPKTYECISINKLRRGIYNTILIRKTDAYPSINKTIKGIRWLEENPNFDLINICNPRVIEQIVEMQQDFLNNNEYTSAKIESEQSEENIKIK